MKAKRYILGAVLAAVVAFPWLAVAKDFTPEELTQRALERRAVEAVLWGLPAVNTDLMRQEMLTKTEGKVNQFIYWGRPVDWHNQTLTPNPDTMYFMAFFNTKEAGPMVFEVPPGDESGSLNGNIVTLWQTALEDVGLYGLDKGKGGKFVILPPGYTEKLPDGYTALPADTYTGYMLLRSNLKSRDEADVANSLAYAKRCKLYPLSAAANPPKTVFTDMQAVDFDSTIRYDARFFDSLNRVMQEDVWIERDRAMIDPLRTLGIEKGKPFAPDAATKAIFDAAAKEAGMLLEQRYNAGFPPFWENSHWTQPTSLEAMEGQGTTYAKHDQYARDARALLYSYGFVSIKRTGVTQFYLISLRDKDGNAFEGGKTYRLNVPPNVPVNQYWSVTAYDRQTHALIKNMARASCASNDKTVQKNADGSIDVYFGPKAPKGKESNWVPTDPQRGFDLMLRVYGPKPEFFEKKWQLKDMELVQ